MCGPDGETLGGASGSTRSIVNSSSLLALCIKIPVVGIGVNVPLTDGECKVEEEITFVSKRTIRSDWNVRRIDFYPVILIVGMDVHSFPRLPFRDDLLSFRNSFKTAFIVWSERFTFVSRHNGTKQMT